MDHYLTVRRWEPNFKPSEALETKTAIWVQFPELPIEYYQDKVLFAIAKSLGKPLKIDWTTAMATRGKFARICIEMDLSKPLKPKFILEGRVGGIWILWDTNHVNVRASSVGPQVIHATIHKEDYEEWVLAVVYASPNVEGQSLD
ncbi:hypothetical protein LOK49_LG15G00480 [Camellia lanceoleosa]|uniref:Uncharacterized protein n=1 Tax=Camellia lanceoleosa TaxID=1840588 RepID=A0ACC0F5U4_9ERIC|nr:hypothetical protein LOK49_LG15G00480 [Camellia lanceoleosa]